MLNRDIRGGRYYGTTGGFYPCEDIALRSMVDDQYSYYQMADVLDRAYHSVVKRVKTLGLLDFKRSLESSV